MLKFKSKQTSIAKAVLGASPAVNDEKNDEKTAEQADEEQANELDLVG